MINLLGEEGYTGPTRYEGLDALLNIEGASIFLYGKKETRAQRKMGHVTIVDEDMASLKRKVEDVKKVIKVIT
jgi:5-(carboxyamino)imidazole ribonucleotide synthase